MKTIDYFKLQAKNLHKDFKTQKIYFDSSLGGDFFQYAPKFFDVDALVTDFEIDENNFSLMNAQHIIARLSGFEKWTEMLRSSRYVLELAKLLFDNMHKITIESWDYYVFDMEKENNIILDDDEKLDIFKTIFADVDGHQSDGYDYRLDKSEILRIVPPEIKSIKKKLDSKITTLPLTEDDRKEFIEVANKKFQNILLTIIEPTDPKIITDLWNPEKYLDEVLKPDMLPIDRGYALSLVEAFLIHHVIELETETEK